LKLNRLLSTVKYDDFVGLAAADRLDSGPSLSEFAQQFGVDTNQYLVFGINIHCGENSDERSAPIKVAFLAADKEAVSDTYAGIAQYADSHGGTLPYVVLNSLATFDEVIHNFKRFDLALVPRVVAESQAQLELAGYDTLDME
jgi:hypothetical protein